MDQNLLAVPHGFAQRATSFIASWCQGIHRMPFVRSIFCSTIFLPRLRETIQLRIYKHTFTTTNPKVHRVPTMHRNHLSEAHTHRFETSCSQHARNVPQPKTANQNFQDKSCHAGKLRHAKSTVITTVTLHHHTSEHSEFLTIIDLGNYSRL